MERSINRRQFLAATAAVIASVPLGKFSPAWGESSTTAPAHQLNLGMNLSRVSNWNTEWAFVDVFKQSAPWKQLNAKGQLPPRMPKQKPLHKPLGPAPNDSTVLAGAQMLSTLMCRNLDGHYPAGRYVCEFSGQGRLKFGLDAQRARQISANRYEMEVTPSGRGISLVIIESAAADPVGNIQIWMPGFEDAKSPFHPLFVDRLKPFRAIRFMDWQGTNNSTLQHWEDRTRPTSIRQSEDNGVAVEYMVDLCNTLSADPWFCMPHLADEEFVRQFALLVKQSLKADRKIYVEWSNEAWNTHFQQGKWVLQQASALKVKGPEFTADQALKAWKIWHDIFGADKHRIIRVAAGQEGGTHVINQMTDRLNGEFDAISCAAYFWPDRKDVLTFNEKTTPEDILKSAIANLKQVALPAISKHKDVAEALSKKLGRHIPVVAYEGGQAIVPFSPAARHGPVVEWQQAAWDCQVHPMMSEAYRLLLDGFSKAGGELFMAFSYASKRGKFGSWGHLQYQDDSLAAAPKYAALLEWQKKLV